MKSFIEFFNCGNYYFNSNKDIGDFIVSKLSYITDKIIPFFEKYPIEGVKAKDFIDFSKASKLIKYKLHLTESGLNEIRLIKNGMNKKRIS